MAGVEPTGFNTKTRATIRSEVAAAFRAQTNLPASLDLQTGGGSLFGQLVDIMTDIELEAWDQGELIYNSRSPLDALGAALDALLQSVGTKRLRAQPSTAPVTLTGTIAAVIPAATLVALGTDDTIQFSLDAAVTIGGGGTGTGTVAATATGAQAVTAATITALITVNPDLTAVTNGTGTVGRAIETDAAAVTRLATLVVSPDASPLDNLIDVLLALTGITAAIIFQNRTDAAVAGRPAKSIETVVVGTVAPASALETSIGNAIWAAKPATIATFGADGPVTVDDIQGGTHSIQYTVATVVDVFAESVLTVDANYPTDGDAQVEAAILAEGALMEVIGQDILLGRIRKAIYSIAGVIGDVTTLDTVDPPVASATVVITEAQIADVQIGVGGVTSP